MMVSGLDSNSRQADVVTETNLFKTFLQNCGNIVKVHLVFLSNVKLEQ